MRREGSFVWQLRGRRGLSGGGESGFGSAAPGPVLAVSRRRAALAVGVEREEAAVDQLLECPVQGAAIDVVAELDADVFAVEDGGAPGEAAAERPASSREAAESGPVPSRRPRRPSSRPGRAPASGAGGRPGAARCRRGAGRPGAVCACRIRRVS
jgi:hypothetical protein